METEKNLNILSKKKLIKIIRNYEEKLSVIEECGEILRINPII